jgi:hypothetical protein
MTKTRVTVQHPRPVGRREETSLPLFLFSASEATWAIPGIKTLQILYSIFSAPAKEVKTGTGHVV